jgi:hypothetical protein
MCNECALKFEAKSKKTVSTSHLGDCAYCDKPESYLTPVTDFWLKKGTEPYKYWLEPDLTKDN